MKSGKIPAYNEFTETQAATELRSANHLWSLSKQSICEIAKLDAFSAIASGAETATGFNTLRSRLSEMGLHEAAEMSDGALRIFVRRVAEESIRKS